MYRTAQKSTGNASRVMAAVAAGLLLVYMVEAVDRGSPSRTLFPVDDETRGAVYGVSSSVLFIAAFALELRERSTITSSLLIAGGATMGTLSIARDALSESGVASIAPSFATASSVGYVIMGLGILHLVKLRESRD